MALFHIVFAILIAFHQFRRLKRTGIDTQTFIGAGFALAYGLAPAYFNLIDPDRVSGETGITIPYADLSSKSVLFGPVVLILYIIAYGAVCGGYRFFHKDKAYPTAAQEMSSSFYLLFGGFCAAVGLASLGYYINQVGGLDAFFSISMFLRSDSDAIFRFGLERVAFLKNSSMIILTGAVLTATGAHAQGWRRSPLLSILFAASFVGSILLLIHQSGRLFLGAFLGSFLISRFLGRRELPVARVAIGFALFAVFASVGKELFWRMAFRDQTITEEISVLRVFHSMMSEILFAHVSAVTAVSAAPDVVPYRMFVDIPIALVNLIPSSLFNFEKIRNIADINTDLVATGSPIPVDLVGFGYYSAGFLGVIVWGFLFGALASWLDSLLADSKRVWSILRAFSAVTFGLRVAYSEPTHILVSSFHMFLAFAGAIPFIFWARGRPKKRSRTADATRAAGLAQAVAPSL